MIDVDVCPCCDSSNTQFIDAREDDDYKYVEMRCKDCGCQYTCQIVETITKVMFDNEDGEQVEYLN
jgi:transcriptional regulator NrdR family protein